MFCLRRQAFWYGWRSPREAINLRPALWVLRKHTQHVLSGNTISASYYGREILFIFCVREDWEAAIDAFGLDLLNVFHGWLLLSG